MTKPQSPSSLSPRPTRPRRHSFGRISFCLITFFFLALLLRNSEIAVRYISDGLSLCAKTLIPSLFPFLVISELLVSGGAIRPLENLLARPFRSFLGISGESGCALLLGFLCGFPLGTKTAASLYRQGRISLEELQHLIIFCNVPSLAFLVFAVGDSLLGSRSLGVELYVITLLSSLLIGVLSNRLFQKSTPRSAPPCSSSVSEPRSPLTVFTEAVGNSATAMIRICAFVLFFSALVGVLERILTPVSLSQETTALIFGIFELTGGVARAAACAPVVAPYLCAALAGWSGLSVHFQIMSLCDGIPLSFSSYFLAKLGHGALNVLLLYGYTLLKTTLA